MAKKSTKKDPLDKARGKCALTQLGLHIAQEKRVRAINKGERDIEIARQRAALRVTKATERVERAAALVIRAEARLVALTAPVASQPRSTPAPQRRKPSPRKRVAPPADSENGAIHSDARDTVLESTRDAGKPKE